MNTTTVDEITLTPTDLPVLPTLTRLDRCCADAKGSCAASVLVQLRPDNEPLLFCSHHFNKAEAALMALNPHYILDNRETAPVNRQQGESYS